VKLIGKPLLRILMSFAAANSIVISVAHGTEKGGSVWPVGAESIAIALAQPGPRHANLFEYTEFYEANETDDQHGNRLPIPDFKIRVFALAPKIEWNTGVNFLGGKIGGWISTPVVYEQIHLPPGKYSEYALGNCSIVPFTVFYHQKIVHWYWELQYQTPAASYTLNAPINVGQHNMALTPGAAITITPRRVLKEVSARVDYVINGPNGATHYHSGNEFFTEFDAMKSVPHTKMEVGGIGYFYQQTTDDTQSGKRVVTVNSDGTTGIGNRGRTLNLGAQVGLPIGKGGGIAFKWEQDLLVQNRTRGNSFWFQFVIPFEQLHRHSH
jgi:hypothetical protein